MKIGCGMAAGTMFAAAAVWFAIPTRADDFSGTYIRTGPGTPSDWQSTWFVTPCGSACAHVVDDSG